MNISRKTLATLGVLGLTTFAVPAFAPAIASADTVGLYNTCDPSQEGQTATDAQGNTLECTQVDTGTGYDWESPT